MKVLSKQRGKASMVWNGMESLENVWPLYPLKRMGGSPSKHLAETLVEQQ